MRLNDLDKSYVAEAPVGMLTRAATKLKKHTPFAPGVRAKAEGADITHKAANQLGLAFQRWIGLTNKDVNKLTAQDLMTFFTNEGYATTAKDIVQQAIKQKTPAPEAPKQETDKKEEPAKITPPSQQPGNPAEADAATKKAYQQAGLVAQESLEARLNSMLAEADGDAPPVTFTQQEADKIILAVVAKVAETKPKALAQKVNKGEKGAQNTYSDKDTTTDHNPAGAIPDEVLDQYGDFFGQFAEAITGVIMSHKDIKPEVKRELSSEILKQLQDMEEKVNG